MVSLKKLCALSRVLWMTAVRTSESSCQTLLRQQKGPKWQTRISKRLLATVAFPRDIRNESVRVM